jgi:hypothetical protein
MTDAQEDPELRRLMDEYVQGIRARNRSVPIIGEFIVSFSHMQASIEEAVVEIVGADASVLLAGERGPEASRSAMSLRHLLMSMTLGLVARPLASAVPMSDADRGGWSIDELFLTDEWPTCPQSAAGAQARGLALPSCPVR